MTEQEQNEIRERLDVLKDGLVDVTRSVITISEEFLKKFNEVDAELKKIKAGEHRDLSIMERMMSRIENLEAAVVALEHAYGR